MAKGKPQEKVEGQMDISATVECSNKDCEAPINLFDIEELIDDGLLYKRLLVAGKFGTDDLGEVVKCPECGTEITVGAIYW